MDRSDFNIIVEQAWIVSFEFDLGSSTIAQLKLPLRKLEPRLVVWVVGIGTLIR